MDEDFGCADGLDVSENDPDPTARGILQCLRMLADEATVLGMKRTFGALEEAIAACVAEGRTADGFDGEDDPRLRVAGSSSIN